MGQPLDQKTADLLGRPNFATVSTLRKDGTVQGVVVWVDADADGNLVLNTAEGRAWRRNVARDPRITVTVPNTENPYEFVSVTGRVVHEDHESADAHIDAMAKKYLGQDTYPFRQEGEVRVKLTVEPDRVTHFTGG
ncbi:MAG: PPOX class F420-dependent oxidoreductase [Solirubrobacteraceae bacterium]|jgi:PPOX class probable F420-dependent enzyme|nr:PPOX class F420-dependent oxidoreductase [Solirubrobacteraceae bacterium]